MANDLKHHGKNGSAAVFLEINRSLPSLSTGWHLSFSTFFAEDALFTASADRIDSPAASLEPQTTSHSRAICTWPLLRLKAPIWSLLASAS
jgi:hypothetical protein